MTELLFRQFPIPLFIVSVERISVGIYTTVGQNKNVLSTIFVIDISTTLKD